MASKTVQARKTDHVSVDSLIMDLWCISSSDPVLALFLIQVSGEVSYNECKLEDLNSQKISAYISQYDLHTPEMTVRETIDFSARCQGVESRKGDKFLPS